MFACPLTLLAYMLGVSRTIASEFIILVLADDVILTWMRARLYFTDVLPIMAGMKRNRVQAVAVLG